MLNLLVHIMHLEIIQTTQVYQYVSFILAETAQELGDF